MIRNRFQRKSLYFLLIAAVIVVGNLWFVIRLAGLSYGAYTWQNYAGSYSDPGRISGVVTAVTDVSPIPDINVRAYRFNGSSWEYTMSAWTDSSGQFEIQRLPVGTYWVEFVDWYGPYRTEYFDDKPNIGSASDVIVSAGATTPNINAALSIAPRSRYMYLPITSSDYFGGLMESEPNNSYRQANGPLLSGQLFRGYPDDPRDYVTFTSTSAGQIEVDLSNHVGQGVQLLLFFGPASDDSRVAYDLEPPYYISYSGAVGTYYVMIYTESGFDNTRLYDLLVKYPSN